MAEVGILLKTLVVAISFVFQDRIHAVVWLFGINLKIVKVEELGHLQIVVVANFIKITASRLTK